MTHSFVIGTVLLVASAPLPLPDDVQPALVRELVDIVRNRTGTQSVWSRVQAAQTLGKLGLEARTAIPSLAEYLDDPKRTDPLVIDEAVVRALGRMGRPARAAIPAMVRASGKDFDLERTVKATIDQILAAGADGGDVPALLRSLHDRDDGTRLRAAKTLGNMGTAAKAAIPELTTALRDPDADVRRQALVSLRKIQPGMKPSDAEIAVYVQDLHDSDPAIRLGAIKSLARMGPALAPAVPALMEVTRDPDPDVRRLAGELLNQLQPR